MNHFPAQCFQNGRRVHVIEEMMDDVDVDLAFMQFEERGVDLSREEEVCVVESGRCEFKDKIFAELAVESQAALRFQLLMQGPQTMPFVVDAGATNNAIRWAGLPQHVKVTQTTQRLRLFDRTIVKPVGKAVFELRSQATKLKV